MDEADRSTRADAPGRPIAGAVARELARVEDFVARAESLPHDSKARSFQDAMRVVLDRGRERPRQRQGRHLHRVAHDAGVPARAAARERA